jgi:signal transduction histidine kinase
MTPLRLTSWFRRRMLPLVVAAALPIAAAAPTAFYLQKRSELLLDARMEAARVAELVRAAAEERPRLWRYDAVRLGERIAAEGIDHDHLRVIADGSEVRVELAHPAAPAPRRAIWGRVDFRVGEPGAVERGGPARGETSVFVAVDAAALYRGTALLAALFTALALVLGSVLFVVPVRAIAGAERRIHRLVGQLALALQEDDRRRISRDLHDGAGQAITAARLQLLALGGDGAQPEELRRVAEHLDEALGEVRRTSAALAPPVLTELGFARAVERHCDAFSDAAGLEVRFEALGDLDGLGAEAEIAGYRIVQEALTNVARHAGATRARVRIGAEEGGVRITISDDGVGLAGGAPGGRGLDGMRERAQLLGGELSLGASEEGGAEIEVRLPNDRGARRSERRGARP